MRHLDEAADLGRGIELGATARGGAHASGFKVHYSGTVAAALAHFRHKPALGFSDCLVLEIAIKAGHKPLGTFDKALGKLSNTQKL